MLLLPLLLLRILLLMAEGERAELTRPIRNIPPLRPHSALPTWRFVKLSLFPKNRHIQSFPLFIKNSLFKKKDTRSPYQQYICQTFTFQKNIQAGFQATFLNIIQPRGQFYISREEINCYWILLWQSSYPAYWDLLKGTIFISHMLPNFSVLKRQLSKPVRYHWHNTNTKKYKYKYRVKS